MKYSLDLLKQIQKSLNRVNTWGNSGICCQIPLPAREWMGSIIHKWPEFSGFHSFPVPCYSVHPLAAFDKYWLWNPLSKYGQSRRRLLKFLKNEVEFQIRLASCPSYPDL